MDIDTLKAKRRSIKASCTRLKNYIESIRDMSHDACVQLQVRKDKLENWWNNYDEIQSQIEVIEQNPESEERGIFEATYFDLMTRLRSLIEGFQGNQDLQVPISNIVNNQHRGQEISRVKLPRLNLPVFSGKYQEWTSFSQMFRTTISGNNNLSDIEKFQYLCTSLTDDAADVIESLELSGENFIVAWRMLEERYDRIRVIVQNTYSGNTRDSLYKKGELFGVKKLSQCHNKTYKCIKISQAPS